MASKTKYGTVPNLTGPGIIVPAGGTQVVNGMTVPVLKRVLMPGTVVPASSTTFPQLIMHPAMKIAEADQSLLAKWRQDFIALGYTIDPDGMHATKSGYVTTEVQDSQVGYREVKIPPPPSGFPLGRGLIDALTLGASEVWNEGAKLTGLDKAPGISKASSSFEKGDVIGVVTGLGTAAKSNPAVKSILPGTGDMPGLSSIPGIGALNANADMLRSQGLELKAIAASVGVKTPGIPSIESVKGSFFSKASNFLSDLTGQTKSSATALKSGVTGATQGAVKTPYNIWDTPLMQTVRFNWTAKGFFS